VTYGLLIDIRQGEKLCYDTQVIWFKSKDAMKMGLIPVDKLGKLWWHFEENYFEFLTNYHIAMNKSRMIFVAACILATLTLFSLYAFVVVPVVLPVKERTILPQPPDKGQPQNRELLEILFPPDSWVFEKTDMISFSDDAGYILYKDSDFLDNYQVRVSPCVVLWFPGNHKELSPAEKYRQAVVLEAANYAMLDFDGPFVISGRPPQLVSGELKGLVTIRSDMKNPGPSDDIKLKTSDVFFNNNQIQTQNEVDFLFGPNNGRGRNLSIHLANTDESKKGEIPNTIKRIELQHLDDLHLYVENDALNYSTGVNRTVSTPYRHTVAYPQTPTQSDLLRLRPESSNGTQNRNQGGNMTQVPQSGLSSASATPTNLSEVFIQCKGFVDLVADSDTLGQWLLTFRDQVNVIRTTQGASDQLNCRELTVTFGQKQDGNTTVGSQNKADAGTLTNFGSLTPLRVKAVGDAGSPVVVRSPENKNFQAKGRQMVLDLLRKELSLTPGDKERSAASQDDEVSLLYDKYIIKGKSLYYAYESDNGPGKLDMPGGGTLEGMTGTDANQRFKLKWSERLLILPDEKTPNLTRIQILGKPEVELDNVGTGSSDEIRILCDMSKKNSAGTGQTASFAPADADFDADLKTIVMQKNVRLKMNNGEILTNELVVNFHQPGTAVGTARTVSRYPDPQIRNQTPATNTNGKLSQMSIFGNNDGSKSTFTIRADLVEVLASVIDKDTTVDQIILTKNVKLDEKTADTTQEAMHISGQKVHITQPDSEQMTVEISGDNTVSGGPAMFQGRGVVLLGANININRATNRFWIDGPGQLRISQQTVSAAGSRGGTGGFDKLFTTPSNSGPENQTVIIDWTRSMSFDGRVLEFIRDVNVNYSRMAINKSDSVRVRLTQPFRFFEKNNNTDNIEPEWVEIRGNIDLERDSFAENNGAQLTHDHIRMTAIEFFPITGAFRGLGPGSISSIFMDTGDSANSLLPNGATAVRTTPTTSNATTPIATATGTTGLFDPGLKFLQCNFHHSVEGNYKTGQVTFYDRVVTMLCPAASFRDAIDTNNTRKIVANGMLLECNKLEIVQPPQSGGNKTVDLKAEGNTRIEMTYDNRYYIAIADKIKFEQGKNLVMLEGNRYSGVELYEGAGLDAPMQKLPSGERVWFNPVTRDLRTEGLRMQSSIP